MYAPQTNRVLIVDDEEGVRSSWNRFLTERGFDVSTAEDGSRAIMRMRATPFDAVVADWRMPGVDGLELLEWAHDTQPKTPFILLTGYGSEELERKARDLGAYGYLNKPISPEALSAMITAAIQLKMLPRAETETETETETGGEVKPDKAVRKHETLKLVGSLVAAPVLSLAFVLFLPVIAFFFFFRVLAEAIQKRLAGTKA